MKTRSDTPTARESLTEVPETVGLVQSRPAPAQLFAFYAAYMVAMVFGSWVLVIPDVSIVVWPPNGIVLAALLTQNRQAWPWWIALAAVGELTGNVLWFHNSIGWALGYVAANSAAVLLAATLLRMSQSEGFCFNRLSDVLRFLVVGVLIAPSISATLGSAIDAFVGKQPFTTTWPQWWLGDATGILIATPLMISLMNAWRKKARPEGMEIFEAVAIATVICLLSVWVLSTGASYAFILPMPIVWSALRFEFRGASFGVLVLTTAIAFYAQNFDHLLSASVVGASHQNMLRALILVAAATGLIVAGVARQQRNALRKLALANQHLEDRVAERTQAIEAAEQRFKATFENAGVGIGIVGGDGTLIQVNDSLAAILGRCPDEMEGRKIEDFTHPEDRSMIDVAWARLMDGMDEYEQEKRYLSKSHEIVWGHTTVSCVRRKDGTIDYLIKVIQDVTERKRSDALRQLLAREVNHRAKNLLAIVQVIARQTAKHSPDTFVQTLGKRLQALAANQDILVHSEWKSVDLSDLIAGQLSHFESVADRVQLSGQPVQVPPAAAQALGMAVHELATNAAKYGSLSTDTGQVEISWTIVDDSFRMIWRETGGPQVTPPERQGFGTTVLEKMTSAAMLGEVGIDYASEGFIWKLTCPMSSLEEPDRYDAERQKEVAIETAARRETTHSDQQIQ
ncbi:MASE1 domain-containing protein [Thalassorhabdomicrobium marinisediminis]|nr:MASE1 domain-containing protein [Thalassorhabdomicrobium marinisediminis]